MTGPHDARSQPSYSWPIFILLAIAGLIYVKWFPYYHRAFTAEATHSMGKSILMGGGASPAAPSFAAALDSRRSYVPARKVRAPVLWSFAQRPSAFQADFWLTPAYFSWTQWS
jgi:hypothetical protein